MAAPHVIQRRLYHYSGRVQGVGFRYTVKNIALRYNVAGYVRNLPDGRVECCLEGPEGDLDSMAEEIGQKMGGFIRNVTVAEQGACGGLVGFVIRH